MENSGLTPEQFALFKAGFLQCSDGSLMPWSPNQEPDPLIIGMMGLHISEKGTSSFQKSAPALKIEAAKRAFGQ